MRVRIIGRNLPGRTFVSDGVSMTNVHVAVQVRADPFQLVAGDADRARWDIDVTVKSHEGAVDFAGPAVHGKRGERFLYLTWGHVGPGRSFHMFRRAKLMLDRIEPSLVKAADDGKGVLTATVDLSDDRGGPRCARVDPPAIVWSLSSSNLTV